MPFKDIATSDSVFMRTVRQRLDPALCTLHPAPCTLHPEPCTLNHQVPAADDKAKRLVLRRLQEVRDIFNVLTITTFVEVYLALFRPFLSIPLKMRV